MARNQVQQDVQAALVRLREQLLQVLIGAVPGSYGIVIGDIITRIHKWGYEAGVDPDGVASQILDIIQLADDTLKVADTVGIGVQEGLGVNLIEYCVV